MLLKQSSHWVDPAALEQRIKQALDDPVRLGALSQRQR